MLVDVARIKLALRKDLKVLGLRSFPRIVASFASKGSTEATSGCINKACVLIATHYFQLEQGTTVGLPRVRAFGSAFGRHIVITNDVMNEQLSNELMI